MQIPVGNSRVVDVVAHGDSGPALLFHHGTPSCASGYEPWVTAARRAGLRWVSFTRAGYGGSSRLEGRTVADNCADVTAVLDRLDVDRFVAVGWSGGGPHALACGALLAPRCAGVVTLAGVAPLTEAADAGFDFHDGMAAENVAEFAAAERGGAWVRDFLESARGELAAITGSQLATSLGGLVDAPDVAALTGGFADDAAASFREALRLGVDGWVDDDLAFTRPWGFDLAGVDVPVGVWQGEQDRMVPYAHGPFLTSRLPDARAHLFPDEGHLSLALGRFDDVIAEARSFLD